MAWLIHSPEFRFHFLLYSLCKMRTTLWVMLALRISIFEILIYQDCDFYRFLDEEF